MNLDKYLNHIQTEGGIAANHAAIALFGQFSWGLWRAISASYDNANKKCGTFTISNTRDACICREKIKRSEKRIKLLRQERNKCIDKDAQQACKDKFDKRIKYEEENIDKQEEKLKKLEEKDRA